MNLDTGIENPLEVAKLSPVMPVIKLDTVKQGLELAEALLEGAMPVMEITLRSDVALDAIQAVSEEFEQIAVGVGTVTNVEEMQESLGRGAKFVVTPGTPARVLEVAREWSVPLIPGVQTATEVIIAKNAGFDFLKFFPAGPAGGVSMLKAFGGPFSDVSFCPTGGVSVDNMNDYLALPNVACVGGSWICPGKLLRDGDFKEITRRASQAIKLAQS